MKSLSFDAILGALVVVSVGAGCTAKKAESVAPAPESVGAPSSGGRALPAAPEPRAAPTIDPTATPTVAVQPAGNPVAPLVDAGTEHAPAPPAANKRGASAACGASGCSPEMKKGSK